MEFRTWNGGRLHRTGSVKTVAIELTVQEVGWVEGGSQPADS